MEPEKVKELIELMKANDLSELEIVDGQTRIMLKRGPTQEAGPTAVMSAVQRADGTRPSGGERARTAPADVEEEKAEVKPENLVEITCPIVGTFYATPSPNAEPFVEVGTAVEPESVVCIIEAMKVMNEVKCGFKGTIKRILVSNGSSVEYGQPLFLVELD